ncbi:MAG: magnesium transporter CorA family protein [Myxococcaceae bacterium]
MLNVTLLAEDGQVLRGGDELLDRQGLKWIELQHPTEETLAPLAVRFGLHKLAVEDCLHLDQRPKLEEYPGHQFIVLQAFAGGAKDVTELTLHEMHFFLGPDWVISVHEFSIAISDAVRQRIVKDPAGTLGRGVDFVVYLLADALIDQTFPLLDAFNDELEDLELKIFDKPDQHQLLRTFELKRMLVQLRRVLSPQRDVIGLLARRGIPNVSERTTLYFRDVYDHLVRMYEQIDAARDMLGNAIDGYLSVVANKTNEVSKQLTIFASIFLPLSFVVGFFGQNFDGIAQGAFLWPMLATCLVLPVAMIAWFRYRDWL